MDITEGTTTEDLWTPYKELVAVIEGNLSGHNNGPSSALHTFEAVLRRHKQSFLALMKNPPKNAASREEIRRGITEGINLPSVGRTLLSKELVEEAIILSDMYDVNEYLALELVHTAQRQAPRHPGLPRGIVAVLLYYDGRKSLVQALKDLSMGRDGVCWSIRTAREEIVRYVTRYMDQLISDGLLGNTLDTLNTYNLNSVLELLQKNRAVPPRHHYTKLCDTIECTRQMLANILFAASGQRGLNRDILLRLMSEQTKSISLSSTGCLDNISLRHHMSLLYALDLSVLHFREDGEELSKQLPLIQDPELIPVLVQELSPNSSSCESEREHSSGVRALCQLSLGLALAALKRAPQSVLRGSQFRTELLDQDDVLVDAALDGKVFEYLEEVVLPSVLVGRDEFYQRRLHLLITDFIVLMHSKMMEMRVKADEAARAAQMYAAEGLSAPASVAGGNGRSKLDALLRCIQKLYSTDTQQFRQEYWLACDTNYSHPYRSGGRAATLYKFVRSASSLTSPSLLAGWLLALSALTVPRHTWALLSRPPISAHHLMHALAQYKQNLCVDSNPFPEHFQASSMGASAIITPAARPGRLLVRQEEVEAMIAALKLIEQVARQDEAACIAICENLQWDAINVMFGLITCHVPLQLKAQLCLTLSALGGSSQTCGKVWAGCEAARLLTTNNDLRSISADLHQIECRIEEYPLSRAFVTLLRALSRAGPVPHTLGAGSRAAGLDPYVQHVLTRLLLPAPHRTYAKPMEKWQMLSECLGLVVQWLEAYSPCSADFPSPREHEVCPPPGLHIALRLHSGGDLLRLVLNTVSEACDIIAITCPQQMYVEQCLNHLLELLERALDIERALVQAAAEAGRSVLIVGLSKLILGGGKPSECPLVLACRVLSSTYFPRPCARALRLLCRATRSAPAARHLLAAAVPDALLIRHGFVECLEKESWNAGDDASINESKEAVLTIIHQTLPNAAPNFAHFLLGYQLTEDVSRSSLHEAGVSGFPRTCLHSVLDMLDKHIAAPDYAEKEATSLIENSYKLVYLLCARATTSAPMLRYLRSRDNFLCRHIKATVNLETAESRTLSARSWLIRACACELGAAAASRQHTALAAMLQTLSSDADRHGQVWEWCLLRRLLSSLSVRVEEAMEPFWELFHPQQLRECIAQCDLPTGTGGKRISVSRVHAIITRELMQITNAQRNLVADEIQQVLDYVTEINRLRNLAATITHYYDSWRQLAEIMFCVAPLDILDIEDKKNLLLNILQDLLNKIPPAEVLPQIGNLASGTILLLMVNLRHCYIMQKRESSLQSSEFETSFFGPSNQTLATKSLTLKFILKKILDWILVSGASTQKVRVNLYGALLNYLNIVNLKTSSAENLQEDTNLTYVNRLDSSKGVENREESALKSMVVDVISGFGENLCSILCNDCIGGGHDVCRMVALSCLDTLIEINPQTDWMKTLTDQGYLRSLIDSLLQDDEGLQQALEPNPKSLRVLYVYESKMALLIKISSSACGASSVLSSGALSCLANVRALGAHPDVHAPAHRDQFLPDLDNRFRQILIPALSLCSALLTALGTENHSCVIHVLHFLLSHLECVDILLRAAHPNSPSGLLLEVEALTSVIARASNREVFGAASTASTASTASSLAAVAPGAARVRALMLALIPRFATPPQNLQDEHPYYHKGWSEETQRNRLRTASQLSSTTHPENLGVQIVCNLLTYARNILERDSSRVLFRPALAPEASAETPEAGPNCGAILELVQSSVRRCHSQSKLLATVNHQLQNVPTMTLEEMKKLLPDAPASSQWSSPAETRLAVLSLLRRRVATRRRTLQYCRHAAEASLYLAWAHIHVYLRVVPPQYDMDTSGSMTVASALRGAAGDDLHELRKGLVAVFNERFAEQLLDIAKDQTPAQRCFLEVLLKDIKSMIQFSPL